MRQGEFGLNILLWGVEYNAFATPPPSPDTALVLSADDHPVRTRADDPLRDPEGSTGEALTPEGLLPLACAPARRLLAVTCEMFLFESIL